MSDRLHVTGVAEGKTIDPRQNAGTCPSVGKAREPRLEPLGLADLYHEPIVSFIGQQGKTIPSPTHRGDRPHMS
jgi:hypothetical protein